ncbi:MAG: dienelactone hydrolase family protein [Silicimonas sp.]|nr:dienelactone hydrolase family protein [Silicimonas sp.]MBT8424633.1 dienelactone hydrolase family protein [Silicimonas sp.]NNF92500.1 prolyl oligopeptidase family serine peptidase [Boseongicola sp.]NNL73679.1 prolyl oligopeptidase family serine peptidase [Silicimonas sp.]
MSELNFKRRASASGADSNVVLFLHGYGADGADLLGLADPLAPHLPDTVFIAVDAPERSMANPMGFQWFPIPWIDGSSEVAAAEGLRRSAKVLDGFIDKVLADEGLQPQHLILFGFSQGTMMSLHVAPRRAEPVAGIVGFSGRLMFPDALASEAISKPPVLLIHGSSDDVVPFAEMKIAAEALQDADFDVYGHVMDGTAHGIAPDGLGVALTFIRNRFGIE